MWSEVSAAIGTAVCFCLGASADGATGSVLSSAFSAVAFLSAALASTVAALIHFSFSADASHDHFLSPRVPFSRGKNATR